ncbi:hypothetical protein SUGI_0769280 [Cryptomeria japonica]|nr:hypothetical protein SUGI_0769280 [Cryptomeria japonica]
MEKTPEYVSTKRSKASSPSNGRIASNLETWSPPAKSITTQAFQINTAEEVTITKITCGQPNGFGLVEELDELDEYSTLFPTNTISRDKKFVNSMLAKNETKIKREKTPEYVSTKRSRASPPSNGRIALNLETSPDCCYTSLVHP